MQLTCVIYAITWFVLRLFLSFFSLSGFSPRQCDWPVFGQPFPFLLSWLPLLDQPYFLPFRYCLQFPLKDDVRHVWCESHHVTWWKAWCETWYNLFTDTYFGAGRRLSNHWTLVWGRGINRNLYDHRHLWCHLKTTQSILNNRSKPFIFR